MGPEKGLKAKLSEKKNATPLNNRDIDPDRAENISGHLLMSEDAREAI